MKRPLARATAALWLALAASAAHLAAEDSQGDVLADLEAFEVERSAFRRLLPGKQGVTAASVQAYYEALFEASAGWTARWPEREFAWRARLEALTGLTQLRPRAAREAAERALDAARIPDGVVYSEPIELLAARALVRHHADWAKAQELAAAGLSRQLRFLDRLEAARGEAVPDSAARRRAWRWKAKQIAVQAAAGSHDLPAWESAVDELALAAPPKPSRDDRRGAIAFAAAQLEIHLQRARLAIARGSRETALVSYRDAVRFRPAFGGKIEPPTNRAALDEARAAWLAAGLDGEEWDAWIARQKGFPIPSKTR